MQIKNIGTAERAVSREGVDHPLMPGAAVELLLSAEEAEALRGIGFEVTGEPVVSPAPAPDPVRNERRGRSE